MKPNVAHLSADSRRWRTGMLIVCAFLVLVAPIGAFQCTPLMPWCSTTMGFGYLYGDRALIVASVDKGGPAARLRPGDAIDLRGLSFSTRWRLRDIYKGYGGVAGESWRFGIERGERRFETQITVRSVPANWGTWADWTTVVTGLWSVFFVALLMTRRPDLIEARLLSLIVLFLVNINGFTGEFAPSPRIESLMQGLAAATFLSVPIVCLASYAARIAPPLDRARKLLTAFSFFMATVLSAEYATFYLLGFAVPASWWNIGTWTQMIALLTALLCAVLAATEAKGDERHRVLWVLAAVAPVWTFYLFIGVVGFYFPSIELNRTLLTSLVTLVVLWLPAALTYAVISRRCIDIGYVINRALIFGLLSVVVLCVFVVVEWALTAWVQNVSRSTSVVINIAVALALGVSIRYLHNRIESFVDRVFFRRRYENETALRRFAREAPYITKSEVLLHRAEQTIERHAETNSVRILMKDEVDENDPAVLTMRTSHEGVELHRWETQLQGELAFPLTSRGRFLGILLCGAKRNGEGYTPAERDSLDAIASGIGSALDTLRIQQQDGQSDMLALLLEIRDLLKSQSSEHLKLN